MSTVTDKNRDCALRLCEMFPEKSLDELTAVAVAHKFILDNCVSFIVLQQEETNALFKQFQHNSLEEAAALKTYSEYLNTNDLFTPFTPENGSNIGVAAVKPVQQPLDSTSVSFKVVPKKKNVSRQVKRKKLRNQKNLRKNVKRMQEMFSKHKKEDIEQALLQAKNDVLIASEILVQQEKKFEENMKRLGHDPDTFANILVSLGSNGDGIDEPQKVLEPNGSEQKHTGDDEGDTQTNDDENFTDSSLSEVISVHESKQFSWFQEAFKISLNSITGKKETHDLENTKLLQKQENLLQLDAQLAKHIQAEEASHLPKAVSLSGYLSEKEICFNKEAKGAIVIEKAVSKNNVVVSVMQPSLQKQSHIPRPSVPTTVAPKKPRIVDELAWMYSFSVKHDLPNVIIKVQNDFSTTPYRVSGVHSILPTIPKFIKDFNETWIEIAAIDPKVVPVMAYYGCNVAKISSILNNGFAVEQDEFGLPLDITVGLKPNSQFRNVFGGNRMLVCAALVGEKVSMKNNHLVFSEPSRILPCFVVEYYSP